MNIDAAEFTSEELETGVISNPYKVIDLENTDFIFDGKMIEGKEVAKLFGLVPDPCQNPIDKP